MPYADQNCRFCNEFVKSNNMSRHIKRWHSEALNGANTATPSSDREASNLPNVNRQSRRASFCASTPTSPSADYVRDAVLCMLRRVDGVNLPSLSTYLQSHFTAIPETWRMPLIIAAFTAVQKAAATHGDVLLNADEERVVWARKSLSRWAHGLSAVEPGHVVRQVHHPNSRDSSWSTESQNCYSPTTNFLIDRDLPVSAESKFERDQFMADFELHRVIDNTLSSSGLVDTRDQQDNPDVEPGDVVESPTVVQEARPRSQGLGTPLTVSTTTVTFPSMLVTSVAGTNIRTEKILSMPTTDLPGVSTSVDTSGSVDMSTKASNDDEIGKATNLSTDVPPSIPDAPESAGQATSMPESFADLLQIHGADVTLLEELSRPLINCISPLSTPIPMPQHDDHLNEEKTAHIVHSSPQLIVEEGLTTATTEVRLADTIPKANKASGMRRKQKTASSSPRSKQSKPESKNGRLDNEGAGQKLEVVEKENLKRASDDDEQSFPERQDKRDLPKRNKVQPPSGSGATARNKSVVAANGNFRIPFRPRPTSYNHYDGGRRSGYGHDGSGEANRRHCRADRQSFGSQSSRRDTREELTWEQRRWLAEMPRYWR